MSSRVLLFTRHIVSSPRFPDGDESPKCVKSFGGDVARGLAYFAKLGDGRGVAPFWSAVAIFGPPASGGRA